MGREAAGVRVSPLLLVYAAGSEAARVRSGPAREVRNAVCVEIAAGLVPRFAGGQNPKRQGADAVLADLSVEVVKPVNHCADGITADPIMADDHGEILADAVARNSAAVLSLPSAGMLRHHKSRFLAQTAEGLWIESATADTPLIESLLQQKTPVGVSFKAPPNKASFAVPILRRDPAYRLNADSAVEALLLQTPDKIKPVQRRNNYRVGVPDGAKLAIRAWRIPDHVPLRDRPLASQMVSLKVRDLSVGGMGVTVPFDPADARAVRSGQRLRIELKWDDIELILEGSLRLPSGTPTGSHIRGGVQFKKLENDLAGRQAMAALTRIVGEFQREEVRRSRLGM